MPKRIQALIVEDNQADAELTLRELRRAGYEVDWHRVDTKADFASSLDPNLDIILSDYAMPQFSGLDALELLNERGMDIPFILVSGTIGEETAVTAMKRGAADYFLKDRLTRLGQAVEHALEQKNLRTERKQAQETLDRLRHHHELILNSAGDGIFGLDLKGNIMFANPKAAKLLGWSQSEILGRPAHDTVHHTHSDGTSYPIDSCPIHASGREGGTRRVSNDMFWRKNGSSFRVEYVVAPIKEESGRINGTIVTFRDITEQFVAESRVKLQEQQYRLLFETNPNPMWVFDSKSLQILAVNEAATAQYGYTRDEFLKLNLKDLRKPEDVPHLLRAGTQRPFQTVTHFSGQFRHIKKDGSPILVDIYSGAIIWEGVAARLATAIDVTERNRAEERLREQADIINGASDAIIIRNFTDRKIVFWNSGAERLYGWTAEEVLGEAAESIFPDSQQVEAMMTTLLATGEFRGEIKQMARDGRALVTEGRATLVRNADGTPRSVLVICTDVTERKKLETQLLRAQRLESIGTLASGVAHDLNNILTPILICAQTIRHDSSREDLESMISLIEGSAKRGANIVKQVLTFARGVEGERVLINPRHLIEEMIDIARKTFPKSIEIDTSYPEDLWSLEVDPTQLHQVLLNLSVNARDAMPNGGSLMLAAENFKVDEQYASMTPGAKSGPYVMLRVSDTGSGMPRAMIDKIFDPFFTTKEIGKGTGLGLSTALGIVKSHGGFISVYSEQGQGTTFKVFLPAKAGDEVRRASDASAGSLKGEGELVLVVDDEPAILLVTKLILEKNNYRVITANDAPEALGIFAQQKDSIKAVLTDIMMPYMDGTALIRSLKQMKPDLRFIASTGQDEQATVSELRGLQVMHFLTKPYSTEKLLGTLRETLSI